MFAKTVHTWDTELSADSVEWCPCDGYQNIIAVGTYQVQTSDNSEFSTSQRHGRIYLHSVDKCFVLLQTLNVAAVLDMKWSPQCFKSSKRSTKKVPKLAVVDAKGILYICHFTINS